MKKRLIVIGGGAAGVFTAVNVKSSNADLDVIVLEAGSKLLGKVRISGGGRCNVTHACFAPRELMQHYPRGGKELLGAFHRFQPRDTVEWFENRGVQLKVESDGRIFPVSNESRSIIDCLLNEARRLGIEIRRAEVIKSVQQLDPGFQVGELRCDYLMLATGSSPIGHRIASSLGHQIIEPVPSLFTFKVPHFALAELSGVAVDPVSVHLMGSKLTQSGPLLITHWGFSGPAALKLSAWGARILHGCQYRTELEVNWLPGLENANELILELRRTQPTRSISNAQGIRLPRKLWQKLIERAGIPLSRKLSQLSKNESAQLLGVLFRDRYCVNGKTTHKEEFVTCGGVKLTEMDFRSMESRICPGLYFAGEILDVDGVTGGFNFQNAWTGAWIAAQHIVSRT